MRGGYTYDAGKIRLPYTTADYRQELERVWRARKRNTAIAVVVLVLAILVLAVAACMHFGILPAIG